MRFRRERFPFGASGCLIDAMCEPGLSRKARQAFVNASLLSRAVDVDAVLQADVIQHGARGKEVRSPVGHACTRHVGPPSRWRPAGDYLDGGFSRRVKTPRARRAPPVGKHIQPTPTQTWGATSLARQSQPQRAGLRRVRTGCWGGSPGLLSGTEPERPGWKVTEPGARWVSNAERRPGVEGAPRRKATAPEVAVG